jgi:hypothetical protein
MGNLRLDLISPHDYHYRPILLRTVSSWLDWAHRRDHHKNNAVRDREINNEPSAAMVHDEGPNEILSQHRQESIKFTWKFFRSVSLTKKVVFIETPLFWIPINTIPMEFMLSGVNGYHLISDF